MTVEADIWPDKNNHIWTGVQMDRETVWLEVLIKREKHRLSNLSNGDRHSVRSKSLDRRWGVVVLTPSSNLDDQVAVENSAASQSLGWSYRINRLISHAQFRTQTCTWRTGQPTWRETWTQIRTININQTSMHINTDEQERYMHFIQMGLLCLIHSKARKQMRLRCS